MAKRDGNQQTKKRKGCQFVWVLNPSGHSREGLYFPTIAHLDRS